MRENAQLASWPIRMELDDLAYVARQQIGCNRNSSQLQRKTDSPCEPASKYSAISTVVENTNSARSREVSRANVRFPGSELSAFSRTNKQQLGPVRDSHAKTSTLHTNRYFSANERRVFVHIELARAPQMTLAPCSVARDWRAACYSFSPSIEPDSPPSEPAPARFTPRHRPAPVPSLIHPQPRQGRLFDPQGRLSALRAHSSRRPPTNSLAFPRPAASPGPNCWPASSPDKSPAVSSAPGFHSVAIPTQPLGGHPRSLRRDVAIDRAAWAI